ncbi:hypothetical protein UY3_08603 [Chelonia mydas]|uniref:Secreted protein n=1 Tax=Chelonia mydas TaxID=8469 RepID=M7BF75_CHEMY|nr:hypothetical protein UY3_08603 [Chelonia mydas]
MFLLLELKCKCLLPCCNSVLSMYAAEVCKVMVTEQHIYERNGCYAAVRAAQLAPSGQQGYELLLL